MEALHMLRLLQCDEEEAVQGDKIKAVWRYSPPPTLTGTRCST